MKLRPGRLLLILLVPALVYGALKGFVYYQAKRAVDEVVVAASGQAEIRYTDISTDLRGVVTVSGITVQPAGYADAVAIDVLRIASDDPMFFVHGARWQPGENAPPPSMSFALHGLTVPLSADLLRAPGAAAEDMAAGNPCEQELEVDARLLRQVGFTELGIDLDGHYRLDQTARTLELGMNVELRDIESMQIDATLSDVEPGFLGRSGGPPPNLGHLSLVLRIAPEFGRQLLKTCAIGTDLTVAAWSDRLADRALRGFEEQGLLLGAGLAGALREFYREWGEFKLVAAPREPVGLLSLMFLPPEQLADALAMQLSINGRPISDTGFSWQRPEAKLSALFGADAPQEQAQTNARRSRIIVRHQYEPVPASEIAQYINSQVRIKPRDQPAREGILKRISDGTAEVEQSLHGGKFTVYVPLKDIQSMQAMVQREVASD